MLSIISESNLHYVLWHAVQILCWWRMAAWWTATLCDGELWDSEHCVLDQAAWSCTCNIKPRNTWQQNEHGCWQWGLSACGKDVVIFAYAYTHASKTRIMKERLVVRLLSRSGCSTKNTYVARGSDIFLLSSFNLHCNVLNIFM